MTRNDQLKRVRQRPFVPFRLIVSKNGSYDIPHPDQIIVARDSAAIGLPMEPERDFYETIVAVALLHIVHLEPLPTGAQATGNGQ